MRIPLPFLAILVLGLVCPALVRAGVGAPLPCRMAMPSPTEETPAIGWVECRQRMGAAIIAVARSGSRGVRIPVARAGPKRARLTLVLPSPGKWIVTVRSGSTALAVRTIRVHQLPLHEAFRVTLDGPELLVADAGGGRGRILRIDPRTGERSIVRGSDRIGRVYDVDVIPGGLIVAADDRVVALRAGRMRVVASGLRGATDLARGDDGRWYVVESVANRLRALDVDSGRLTTIVGAGLDQPVAVAIPAEGGVLVADGHGGSSGRVLRVEPTGHVVPLIEGLGLPTSIAPLADGRLLVVDHVGHQSFGRVLLFRGSKLVAAPADGTVRAPTSAIMAADGTIYATSGAPPGVGRIDARGKLRSLTS